MPQAKYIGDRFERALLLFRQCHVVYNSAEHVSEEEADSLGMLHNNLASYSEHFIIPQLHCLGTAITKFMAYYRSTFPTATVLPKMHFLEDHAVNFIKKWGTGFGFLGEQGGESIHAVFNTLQRVYNNIPNKVDQLFHMVREHHLRLCPQNLQEAPGQVKRKKTE